jgi:hypothetical protein
MITYEKLKEKPRLFKRLTGVSVAKFNDLLQKIEPIWLQMNYERLDRPNRQRSIGGGPDYKLKLRDRLLMTLMLLHSYLNTDALGFFFEVNKSTVSRNTRNILPALDQVNDETLSWPRPPKRGEGKTLEQILQKHPDLKEMMQMKGSEV